MQRAHMDAKWFWNISLADSEALTSKIVHCSMRQTRASLVLIITSGDFVHEFRCSLKHRYDYYFENENGVPRSCMPPCESFQHGRAEGSPIRDPRMAPNVSQNRVPISGAILANHSRPGESRPLGRSPEEGPFRNPVRRFVTRKTMEGSSK